MKKVLEFCPVCEETGCLEYKEGEEIFKINEEEISVFTSYYVCKNCESEIEDPYDNKIPVTEAYRIYKQKHNMLQAEEIKELRKKYGLTQGELGKILGLGMVTISRYENECLQTRANDNLLRTLENPSAFLSLLEKNEANLPEMKINKIKNVLSQKERQHYLLDELQDYKPDIYSGFKEFSVDKVINAILFFCRNTSVVKTKLNKLLFFADFKFFKEYGVSITGLRYARIQHGPVPDKYQTIYAMLIDELNVLNAKEVIYNDEIVGEEYFTDQNVDLDLFDENELKILAETASYFKNWTATKISNYSLEEDGWLSTEHTKYISYEYAEKMSM